MADLPRGKGPVGCKGICNETLTRWHNGEVQGMSSGKRVHKQKHTVLGNFRPNNENEFFVIPISLGTN